MQRYLGFFFILLAAVFWSLLGPVSLFSLTRGFSPIEVAFWRAGFGALFFTAHALATGRWRIGDIKDGVIIVAFGAVCVGGFFASYQAAVLMSGAALASVLLYTAPAWVCVLSLLFFKEKLTLIKLLALTMSLAGAACVSLSGGGIAGDVSFVGIFFGALSGFLYSTHYIFSKFFLNRYSAVTIYSFCLMFGALALLPAVDFAPKEPVDWVPLVVLGLVCTYGAYLTYCEGVKRLDLTKAAVLATLEPVLAMFFAWLWWTESFRPVGWVGAVLILGAVIIMIFDSKPGAGTDKEQCAGLHE